MTDLAELPPPAVWEWEPAYGGNSANSTAAAQARPRIKEPAQSRHPYQLYSSRQGPMASKSPVLLDRTAAAAPKGAEL